LHEYHVAGYQAISAVEKEIFKSLKAISVSDRLKSIPAV
jgi:hypothetical protein